MENNTFYAEVITDHNMNPTHKHALPDANYSLEGVNPSCGDDIVLNLKIEDGIIKDAAYEGNGCAISQASADMMIDLVKGKTTEEAEKISDTFLKMIKGHVTEDELDSLEEASVLKDVSHMPARVKCAVLGWHTLEEIIDNSEKNTGKDSGKES